MRLIPFLSAPLLALAVVVSAAEQNGAAPSVPPAAAPEAVDDQKAIMAVIDEQTAAYNRKDVPAIMGTMDPKSPVFATTEGLIKKVNAAYDLKYTISDVAIKSIKADEAEVSFTQTTEKVKGPQFRNNRLKGVHVFRKLEGKWKLYETKVQGGVEYLDK